MLSRPLWFRTDAEDIARISLPLGFLSIYTGHSLCLKSIKLPILVIRKGNRNEKIKGLTASRYPALDGLKQKRPEERTAMRKTGLS